MKDTKKPLRNAIKTALSGLTYSAVSVPVYDEKVKGGETPSKFVILGTQQENEADSHNDENFHTLSSIELEVYDKTATECSKDAIDDICSSILQTLIPTPNKTDIILSGFQVRNARRESCVTYISIDQNETIVYERIRLVFTIIEQ